LTELLKIFADQPVIAIENTRLFEAEQVRSRELSERTRDLSEALDHQLATADILRAIAASPTNIGPVLQVVVETAARLCDAYDVGLVLREGDFARVSAHHRLEPDYVPD
jgi:hypothetical protein